MTQGSITRELQEAEEWERQFHIACQWCGQILHYESGESVTKQNDLYHGNALWKYCDCPDAKAKQEAYKREAAEDWEQECQRREAADKEAQEAMKAKPTASIAPPLPMRDDGLAMLRRQAAQEQAAAARQAKRDAAWEDVKDQRLALAQADIAKRVAAMDADGQTVEDDLPDWEAFEDARLVIEVDPNKVTLPAIMERTDLRTILYAQTVNYIASRPNGGKTWLVIKSMVQGETLGGRFVILDYDMKRPNTLARRALAMGYAELFKDKSKFFFADLDKWEANAGLRAAAAEWLLDAPNPVYSAVVIDTDTSAGAANDGGDIRKWWTSFVTPWERREIGVIVLAHLPKNDGDGTHGPMGSGDKRAKLSGASYMLETIVSFNEDQGGLVHMIVDKDKHGQLPAVEGEVAADVVFTWMGEKDDKDRWMNITIEPHEEHRHIGGDADLLTETLYNALAEYPDGVYSQKTVKALVKGNGKLIGESLYTLIRAGRVLAQDVEGKKGKTYLVDLFDSSDSSDSSDSRIANS